MKVAPLTPQQRSVQEAQKRYGKPEAGWRAHMYNVIFESETRAGRAFDLVLIAAILISVTVVVLSSVASVAARHGPLLLGLEWFFTFLFTIEYLAPLACPQHPVRYARSCFGIIACNYFDLNSGFIKSFEYCFDIRFWRIIERNQSFKRKRKFLLFFRIIRS